MPSFGATTVLPDPPKFQFSTFQLQDQVEIGNIIRSVKFVAAQKRQVSLVSSWEPRIVGDEEARDW